MFFIWMASAAITSVPSIQYKFHSWNRIKFSTVTFTPVENSYFVKCAFVELERSVQQTSSSSVELSISIASQLCVFVYCKNAFTAKHVHVSCPCDRRNKKTKPKCSSSHHHCQPAFYLSSRLYVSTNIIHIFLIFLLLKIITLSNGKSKSEYYTLENISSLLWPDVVRCIQCVIFFLSLFLPESKTLKTVSYWKRWSFHRFTSHGVRFFFVLKLTFVSSSCSFRCKVRTVCTHNCNATCKDVVF